MPYRLQYGLALVALLAIVGLGTIQGMGGEALGLSARAMAWLGVLTAVLGAVQSVLPKIYRYPTDERTGQD